MDESTIKKHINDFVQFCKEYISYNEIITNIYIYISFEGSTHFRPFFGTENIIVSHGSLNKLKAETFDTSNDAQIALYEKANTLILKLKEESLLNKDLLPTQIKIIYSVEKDKIEVNFLYENFISEKIMISHADLADRWFAELGGQIRPTTLLRLKQLFGEDFLEKKNS